MRACVTGERQLASALSPVTQALKILCDLPQVSLRSTWGYLYAAALQLRNMNDNKSSITKADSYEKIGEFWDNNDVTDYWDKTVEVEFEVEIDSQNGE